MYTSVYYSYKCIQVYTIHTNVYKWYKSILTDTDTDTEAVTDTVTEAVTDTEADTEYTPTYVVVYNHR